MKDKRFRCRHCKKLKPRRSENQRFCSDEQCQKARKNQWRRKKYESDPDYRANQQESTRAWLDAKGGSAVYHRQYRRQLKVKKSRAITEEVSHLSPVHRMNDAPIPITSTQGLHPSCLPAPQEDIANSDGITAKSPMISGRYRLVREGANSDAFYAKIEII